MVSSVASSATIADQVVNNNRFIPLDSSSTGASSGSPAASNSNTTLGPNAFLQLLTTELQNQDPTKPQDPTQQVSQLAQMSALQYQQQLTSAFQNFQNTFGVMQSASLIGKSATVEVPTGNGNASTVTGTINTISVQNGAPYFTMKDSSGNVIADKNGQPLLFSTQQIVGIGS